MFFHLSMLVLKIGLTESQNPTLGVGKTDCKWEPGVNWGGRANNGLPKIRT